MRAFALLLTLALVMPLSAAECVWNGTSGDWGDSAGWMDGVKPSAGDTVKITGDNVEVTVGDSDIDSFRLVAEVVIESSLSRLVIDTSAASSVDVPAVFSGEGTIVKKGTATVNLTTAGSEADTLLSNLAGGLVVSNGTVQLPNRAERLEVTRLEVGAPGILSLGNSPTLLVSKGLWGDGTISNGYSGCELYYNFPDRSSIHPVFSGAFMGSVRLTPYYKAETGPGSQYLTGISETDLKLHLYGVLGVKTLGMAGQPGSAGTGEVSFYSSNGQLRFLNEEDETTDKILNFRPAANIVRLDAGSRGGVTFTGVWNLPAYTAFGNTNNPDSWKYNTIVLTGSNSIANVINSNSMYDTAGRSTVYWRKEGTGVWRFGGEERNIKGTIEVNRGTLQFESIAEKGVLCALGDATRTGPDVYTWDSADRVSSKVPMVAYAYRLGNMTSVPLTLADEALPTMEYTGSSSATCSTRPFVIDGVGRILSTGGSLNLAGASAFTQGAHTFVLDGGAATVNRFASITNGPHGTLGVVKRGAGMWMLTDDINVDSVKAEQGTLAIGSAYSFYRWTITANNYGAGGKWIAQFNGFALMDKEGNMINGTVGASGMNTAKRNQPEKLLPGEMCYGRENYSSTENRYPSRGFHWLAEEQKFKGSPSCIDVTVMKNDESTHPIVYFRVDEGVEVAKYDVLASGNWARDVVCWELAGSLDGKNWDVLHTRDTTYKKELPANYWHSTGSSERGGWDIAVYDKNKNSTFNIGSVSAAPGATVAFIGNAYGLSVSNIVLDATNGGGAIRGATFAPTGVLILDNWDNELSDTKIPLDIGGCSNLGNIANWTVLVGGKELKRNLLVAEDGITVRRSGLTISVR
jgi:hypothetical protein